MICSFRPYKGGNPKHVQVDRFRKTFVQVGQMEWFLFEGHGKQGKTPGKG
jgi:hypothetical protein